MELYSEADKTIWEEKYMPVSLKKGQKVSLTKGNPGLKNVVVGIGLSLGLVGSEMCIRDRYRMGYQCF